MKTLVYDYENNIEISTEIDEAIIRLFDELEEMAWRHDLDIVELAELVCADAVYSHLLAAEGLHDSVLAGKQESKASKKRLKDDYGISIDTDKLNKIFNI